MKKICSLFLTAVLVYGSVLTAQAAEITAKGSWDFVVEWSNVAPRNGSNNRSGAMQRFRTQIDVIASESLKGVVFFEIGTTEWGQSKDGGALGTDGMNVDVRYSYIDWQVPNTPLRVRVGLQPVILPGFVASGFSPVFGHDLAAVTASAEWTDNIATSLFWARPFNGNFGGWNANNTQGTGVGRDEPGDAMDLFGLTVPIKTDVVKVSPWGLFGLIGTKSVMGDLVKNEPATWAPRAGLYPILGSGYTFATFPYFRNNTETHETAWWLGITAETSFFSPLTVAADLAYGSVSMGEIPDYAGFADGPGTFSLDRDGWYAALRMDYALDWGTPGVIAWYGSGDDSNPYNGSERLPQFNTPWAVSSLGFGGGWNDMTTWKVLGHNPSGLWGGVLYLKDMNFVDDLRHTVRAGYYRGTNSSNMPKEANMWHYPTRIDGPFAYLTTTDWAWEVNAETRYDIYKNLTVCLDLAYVRLNLDEDTWTRAVVNEVEKDSYKVSVALRYSF